MNFGTKVLSVGASAMAVALFSAPKWANASVPYSDPAVIGSVGLCDAQGHEIRHGSIDDQPFVWRAVSSVPAPDGYGGPGATATLAAFQPRPDVSPDRWSGDTLTSSSTYTNPRYPMAQATAVDFSLKVYLDEYRPMLDGLVQLRIYFSSPGAGGNNTSYAATDIRISRDTWQVVRGASVPCTKGRGIDSETVPTDAATRSAGGKSTAGGSTASRGAQPSSGRSSTSASTPGGNGLSTSTTRTSAAAVETSGGSSSGGSAGSAGWWIGGSVGAAAVLAGLTMWWRRRGAASPA